MTEDDLRDDVGEMLQNPDISQEEINRRALEWKARGADLAKIAGAFGAAIAGGDAGDVNLGGELGASAAENNALPLVAWGVIAAAGFALEAADKGLLAYDVYRLQEAIDAGDDELAADIGADLAIAGGVEVVAGIIPGSVLATKVGQNIFKKVDGSKAQQLALRLTSKNANNSILLKNQLTAEQISNGHAFQKHVLDAGEFPEISTPKQFQDHIETVINNPSHSGQLSNGRSYSYDINSNTIVVKNPNAPDGGTAFRINKTKYPDPVKDYIEVILR